jgi:hypothetical protein
MKGFANLISDQTRYDEFLKDVIRRHQIAVEQLTEQQFVEALKQAIASGDFQRHVRIDDIREPAQSVVYVPYRDIEALKTELANLKKACERARKILEYPSDQGNIE